MRNALLKKLQSGKNSRFKRTQTSPCYQTGYMNFDYQNGYILNAQDENDNIIARQEVLGLVGGSFTTIIGKSGVAKTTFACQIAANIIRKFKNGFVIHYDVEQATNPTRVKNLTRFSMSEMEEKYVLKQDTTDIEDIYTDIMEIYNEKMSNRAEYEYDTGVIDEFGQPIIALEPTVILLDSIPTLTSSASSDKNEMEGGTYANRIAKALSQFYKRMTPKIKQANIIFISINHITAKMEINPFAKSQPQLLYLDMDESMPGGNAPTYYANNIIKFKSKGKFTEEKHGFDGFRVTAQLLKSRTNKAGKMVTLIYNQDHGFDAIHSNLELIEELKLLEGRNPYRYIKGFEDVKFSANKIREEFLSRFEVREAMIEAVMPYLRSQLSDVYGEEDEKSDAELALLEEALAHSNQLRSEKQDNAPISAVSQLAS